MKAERKLWFEAVANVRWTFDADKDIRRGRPQRTNLSRTTQYLRVWQTHFSAERAGHGDKAEDLAECLNILILATGLS